MNDSLYLNCRKKNIEIGHAVEVGVHNPETSNILRFIKDGARATLVEPDPDCAKRISEYFAAYPNVKLIPVAISDSPGRMVLCRREASTFAKKLSSTPAKENDGYTLNEEDEFEVDAKRFNEIDNGDIELLSVDIEGSEWFVIQDLKSRPKIISIETHGKSYLNPFMEQITHWAKANGYREWHLNLSDTIYMRSDIAGITFLEKMLVYFSKAAVSVKRPFYRLRAKLRKFIRS